MKELKWSKIKISKKPNQPSKRQCQSVFEFNDKMYIFGGYDGAVLNDLWEYDPEKNSWEEKASGSNERYRNSCCSINDKMYVFGGCDKKIFLNDFMGL